MKVMKQEIFSASLASIRAGNFFMCFMVKFLESVTLGDAKLRYERNLNIFTMKDMPAQPQAREVREVLFSVSSCASW